MTTMKIDRQRQIEAWIQFCMLAHGCVREYAVERFNENGLDKCSDEELLRYNFGWIDVVRDIDISDEEILRMLPEAKDYLS